VEVARLTVSPRPMCAEPEYRERIVFRRMRTRIRVVLCKSAPSALYALANSNRSVPPSVSKARKRSLDDWVY
jgi:hypothetical protein